MFWRSIRIYKTRFIKKTSWLKRIFYALILIFFFSELIAIEKEIQEMQNTPSPSEEEIQEYCVEKASLERKQSGDLS